MTGLTSLFQMMFQVLKKLHLEWTFQNYHLHLKNYVN